MKSLVTASILLLLLSTVYTSAHAQHASDPNAIDLTNSLDEIDTASLNESLFPPLNIGDVNGDMNDDIIITRQSVDSNSHAVYSSELLTLSVGGVGTKLSISNIESLRLAADLDGDGRKDVVTANQDGQTISSSVHWGIQGPAFFSDSGTVLLGPANENTLPLLSGDYDGDGTDDVFSFTATKAYLYRGKLHDRSAPTLLPYDSLATTNVSYHYRIGQALGHFTNQHNPQLVIANSGWSSGPNHTALFRVMLYPNAFNGSAPDLWHSTPIVLYEDSVLNSDLFVYTTPILAYDITGDGIDDLLICDSIHVYVFKGGSNFGTKKLTRADADFVITSPGVLDPLHFDRVTFGTALIAAGNLSGTGVPYLVVSGQMLQRDTLIGVMFLYAGGSALDTYYDGIIRSTGAVETPVVSSQGIVTRTNMVMPISYPDHRGYYLLARNTGLLPHTIFSYVAHAPLPTDVQLHYLAAFKVELIGAKLEPLAITNLLGQTMHDAKISSANDRLTIDLANYPAGVYFLRFRSAQGIGIVKLMR